MEPIGYDGFGAPLYPRADGLCALCGQPARGLAYVGEERYCHDGEDPTCYMIATWAQQVPILGRAGDWLIDALEKR